MRTGTPEPHRLFITGMLRSGTTLLDKLVSAHPSAFVASQPLSLVYVAAKRQFLLDSGRSSPAEIAYPLNDLFGRFHHDPSLFTDYLRAEAFPRVLYEQALREMVGFGGRSTYPESLLDMPEWLSLHEFVARYVERLSPSAKGARLVGSKENYCSEFVPYLLAMGVSVVVVVRDPRDVLSSLNFGRGSDFGGLPRPYLFTLRQWRTMVAFALDQRDHPGLLTLRYEDLVREPKSTLDRLASFLGIGRFADDVGRSEVRSQSGERWKSNSSFEQASRISEESVGRYREILSPALDRWIQACCLSELRVMNYLTEIDANEVTDVLRCWEEDQELARPALEPWRWTPERRDEEIARWVSLQGGRPQSDLFLSPAVFDRLRAGLRVGVEG